MGIRASSKLEQIQCSLQSEDISLHLRVPSLPGLDSSDDWGRKQGRGCSVENIYLRNHDIISYGLQDDLTALAPVLARPQGRAKPPFDHGVDGLDLPSLPIGGLVSSESLFHDSPPVSCWRLVRRPALRWRNDRPDTEGPYSEVDPLSIEASVSQQCANPRSEDCLTQHRAELHQVRARAAAGRPSQDHVALRCGNCRRGQPNRLVLPGTQLPCRQGRGLNRALQSGYC